MFCCAAEAGQSASSAARHAEHSLAKSGGPQLDEFGRDISLEGNNSEAERKFRLQQRNDRMKASLSFLQLLAPCLRDLTFRM